MVSLKIGFGFIFGLLVVLSCLFISVDGVKIDFEQAKDIWNANNVKSLSKVSPPTSNDCCSPQQWETLGWEVNHLGSVFHVIYYDAINKLVRWDRYGNLEKPGVYDVLILWTNYTTEPFRKEYLYRPKNDTCYLYGADEFNAWCFGSTSNQTYMGTATLGGSDNNVWGQAGTNYTWGSSIDNCLPVVTSLNDDLTIFYNTTLGISDPSVFTIPKLCLDPNGNRTLEEDFPKSDKKKFFGTFF